MNKKILLLFTAIIFMMSTSNVSASEGCGVYTEEDLAFYESLNRPDIYVVLMVHHLRMNI